MFLHCPCCFARVLFFLWRQNGQTDSLPEESRPCSLQHQPILWSVTWRGNGTNRTPKMVVDRETRNDVSTSKKRWHEIIETASFQLGDPWMDHPNGGSLRNNTPKNRGHPGRTGCDWRYVGVLNWHTLPETHITLWKWPSKRKGVSFVPCFRGYVRAMLVSERVVYPIFIGVCWDSVHHLPQSPTNHWPKKT